MTNPEFSAEFDVLYNNITSNQAPGLDEYEKSVFLTKAQDEILKAYFNPKGNKFFEGFDDSAVRQIDFSNLIYSLHTTLFSNPSIPGTIDGEDAEDIKGIKSVDISSIDEPIYIILNESLVVERDDNIKTLQVIPVKYSEYMRLMNKPFKRPLKNQAWRLITYGEDSYRFFHLIAGPSDILKSYNIRYLRQPRAIILSTLEGATIEGETNEQSCELDPILHKEILQRAVELAKAAYSGDLTSQVILGQASATNLGGVQSNNSQ